MSRNENEEDSDLDPCEFDSTQDWWSGDEADEVLQTPPQLQVIIQPDEIEEVEDPDEPTGAPGPAI